MMYVKWDFENNKILYGPQEITRKGGDGWIQYISHVEFPIYDGEYLVIEYVEEDNLVVQKKAGIPTNIHKIERSSEYPGFDEQLDLLWHAIDAGAFGDPAKLTDFYTTLKTVKDNYPKVDLVEE